MKQSEATIQGTSGAGGGVSGHVKASAKRILDRIFLRSTIHQIRKKVRDISKAVPAIERDLDVSVALLSKKIDYLLAKIDAYAHLDDTNHAAILKDLGKREEALKARLETIEQSGKELAGALDALRAAGQEESEKLQEAFGARLAAIEAGNTELAGAFDALRAAGQEESERLQEAFGARLIAMEAGNAKLAGVLDAMRAERREEARGLLREFDVARRMEAETAFREELRSRYDAMAARLAVIEIGNARLTDRFEAAQEADKQMSEAVSKSARKLAACLDAEQTKLETIEAAQASGIAKLEKSVEKVAFNEFRQHEALAALLQLLKLEQPLPPTRGWAASPDFLLHLYQHIAAHRPKVVVELGSGVSTLVAAAALAANGDGGHIYSLDHDESYARATSDMLAQHRISGVATVHHAPLLPWKPPRPTKLGEEWRWYAVPEEVEALRAIDLLVLDGPPKDTGPFARYPAVPHFRDRMTPACTVLLDDAQRPDERAAAETWSREDGLKLDLRLTEFEKGVSILTVESHAGQQAQ